jgi:hypothetical protein
VVACCCLLSVVVTHCHIDCRLLFFILFLRLSLSPIAYSFVAPSISLHLVTLHLTIPPPRAAYSVLA